MKKLITTVFLLLSFITMTQAQISWDQVKHSTTETPKADTAYFSIICRGGAYQSLCQRYNDSISVVGSPAITNFLPGDSLVWRVIKGEAIGTSPRVRFINTKTGQYLYVGKKNGTTKRVYMGPRQDSFSGTKDFFLYDRGPRVPAEYYYGIADAADGTLIGNPTAGTTTVGASSNSTAGAYQWRFNKKMGLQPKPELLPTPIVALTTTTTVLSSGGSIVLNAQVTKGATDLLGTVSLYNGTTLITTLSLDADGKASYTYNGLVYGIQNFVLVYSGDAGYEPNDAILSVTAGPSANAKAVNVTITPAKTSTEVHSDYPVSFSVKDVNGDPVSTGTLQVMVNGITKNTFTPDALGAASVNFPNLLVGDVAIQAKYIGDKNNYLDSDTAKVITAVAPSSSSAIPYPVYYDLGTIPEIMKFKLKYPTATQTRATNIKFSGDSCSSIMLATDTLKATKVYYANLDLNALQVASQGLKETYASCDRLNIPFGNGVRPSWFSIKTPWLNKGAYNIYISQRVNQASGMIPKVELDGKAVYYPSAELVTPAFRSYAGNNIRRWCANGNDNNLAMHYFGSVVINNSDVHSLKFTSTNAYGETAWLDMVQFIPVDQDSLKITASGTAGLAKSYWPRFDIGGYARQADFSGTLPATLGSIGDIAVNYQVTDPTVYTKNPYTLQHLAVTDPNLGLLGVDYVVVFKKDKWTRVAEGVVTSDSTYTCDLADGDYYYQEYQYTESTNFLGALGKRVWMKEGTFRVGPETAVKNVNSTSIRTYAVGKTLTVKGIKAGAKIMVTDLMGRAILNTVSTSDVFTSTMKQSSIYIVKVISGTDYSTSKVLVK
jgi:hypothetical protein